MKTLYILAALPRTGSSLLCDILANAGVHGGTVLGQHWEETTFQIAARMKEHAPVGVIKPILQHMTRRECAPDVWLDRLRDQINAEREIWFFLDRYDKIRQAFSYERALVLDEWLAFDEPAAGFLHLDPTRTFNRMKWMFLEQRWWSAYFATRGLHPTRLFYEDWTATQDTVDCMGEQVLQQAGLSYVKGRMRKKQAGEKLEFHVKAAYRATLEAIKRGDGT